MYQGKGLSPEKPVAIWLFIGVGMIMVQVLLGGITRLTGSGLSITEWQPLLGTIPPLNDSQWNEAFEKYKAIGQYKQINFYYKLEDFKYIYFWEWMHRLWARLIAIVFAIPFIFFLLKGYFRRSMVFPLLMLFVLGAVQGLLGWIMVKSGLNAENIYVSHFRLAIHFMAALGLLAYVLWFALRLRIPDTLRFHAPRMRRLSLFILFILLVQLVFGAFMAGLKAAVAAPTWPTINGEWIPSISGSGWSGDPIAVHFIHRGLAYLLVILVIYWWVQMRRQDVSDFFRGLIPVPVVLIGIQLTLGIVTVLYSTRPDLLLWFGALHQFTAMLFLACWVMVIYLLPGQPVATRVSA